MFAFGAVQGHQAQNSQVTRPGLHSKGYVPRHNYWAKACSNDPLPFFPECFHLFV